MPISLFTALLLIQATFGVSIAVWLAVAGLFVWYCVKFNAKRDVPEWDDHVEVSDERRKELMGVILKSAEQKKEESQAPHNHA
jgi:heme/copper-type cytochrome/quinol oxidase subunit 2